MSVTSRVCSMHKLEHEHYPGMIPNTIPIVHTVSRLLVLSIGDAARRASPYPMIYGCAFDPIPASIAVSALRALRGSS
jgi:hypothetical protein